MSEVLENFDWVKERYSCSAAAAFERLRMEVEQDINQRNALRPEMAHYGFKFVSSNTAFAVVREGNNLGMSVTFTCEGNVIFVKDANRTVILKATLTLGNDGVCRFRVGEEELESWQLRKKLLESMFFGADLD